MKRNLNEIYVCSEKNLRDDQDELKKICQRFAGTTRPLTFLRKNLTVKEFVHVLDFFPELRIQVDVKDFDDECSNVLSANHEVLIFFGESDNLMSRMSSSRSLWITNLDFSPSESSQDDKKEIDSKIALTEEPQETITQSIDINEECSNEVFSKISDEKAALIPLDKDSSALEPPKKFQKTHKVLFLTILVVSTVLAMKFSGFKEK